MAAPSVRRGARRRCWRAGRHRPCRSCALRDSAWPRARAGARRPSGRDAYPADRGVDARGVPARSGAGLDSAVYVCGACVASPSVSPVFMAVRAEPIVGAGEPGTQANMDTYDTLDTGKHGHQPGAFPLVSVNTLSNLRRVRLDPTGERSLLTSGLHATANSRRAWSRAGNGTVAGVVRDRMPLSCNALPR